ncbi:MAG: ribonuclease H-like domain-containing protein [Anaeromicrobium sp.]|jgi:uncharacterized protein YprB with RNaseH-like and TPR domain|uniref:ribonuclease H-like domain-containing protein n=1 Tax=Anaeromicrobium sp. TaxID=1929132 RepID=UPI0025CF23DF|nr:ribonuclease H-like domain-containing protein [Anaeromicrobium sp.]MCT4593980.1 ribonuclease H-like domain-containing protein [Anaeromicrobium sp.]
MEIFIHEISESFNTPSSFNKYYSNLNFAFFDIETTGLSRKNSKIILIGILYICDGKIIVKQYFCNNRSEEKEMLLQFMKDIRDFHLLISYNGNAFDIPFINERLKYNKISDSINPYKSMDFLCLVRRNKDLLNLHNYKLKSVEELMGIHRNDTISGKDSVALYNIYEETKDEKLLKVILLHNYDDLYFFSKTLKILDLIPEENLFLDFPYVINHEDYYKIYISKHIIKNSALHIEGSILWNEENDYFFYDTLLDFKYEKYSNKFSLKILLEKGLSPNGEKCLYLPLDRISNMDGNLVFKLDKNIQPNSLLYFYKNLLSTILKNMP